MWRMVSSPTNPSSLATPEGHEAQGWLDGFLAALAASTHRIA